MADRATLLVLASRVEAASGPHDVLDEAIMGAIFRRENRFIGTEEEQDDGTWMRVPDAVWVDPTTDKWASTHARRFTTDLDAAASLVPEGWQWLGGNFPHPNATCYPIAGGLTASSGDDDEAPRACSVAAALTAAALRALAQEATSDEQ